jgi:hypothetical protein
MPHIESPGTTVQYLRYAHGLYNSLVILLFLYQGWLGMKIRQGRIAGNPPEINVIKKHRKFGPVLATLGLFGFAGGISTVYLGEGEIFEHPLHFVTGVTICALIITTYLISRNIRARKIGIRTIHFMIGVSILCLYLFQAYLGINMLF